jgi:hypothetical protein
MHEPTPTQSYRHFTDKLAGSWFRDPPGNFTLQKARKEFQFVLRIPKYVTFCRIISKKRLKWGTQQEDINSSS